MIHDDEYFMRLALEQAHKAQSNNEVPIGAVLVSEGQVIAAAHNQPITLNDPTAHAEILVLRTAAESIGNYRLCGTTLYVTLEPCAMCVGAMIHARIDRLVYAASDPKTGAVNGAIELLEHHSHNHRIAVSGGLFAEESSQLLKAFFQSRR